MAGRKPTTARARFDEKCKAVESGCVEWQAARNGRGYGYFRDCGRMQLAHRWNYERTHGPLPADIDVCHECDNPPCVNLGHLFPGTRKVNMEDAARKGRMNRTAQLKGERHPGAVLDACKVDEIREFRAQGLTLTAISDVYGVSVAHVSRIVNNQSWKESA